MRSSSVASIACSEQRYCRSAVADQAGRLRGPAGEGDAVDVRRHAVEDLEGAAEARERVGNAYMRSYAAPALDRGGERPFEVAGGVPVARDLTGDGGRRDRLACQRLRRRAMHPGALVGQQLGVHDLAEGGVLEREAVVADLDAFAAQGGPQPRLDLRHRLSDRVGHERQRGRAADDRGRPEHATGLLRQPVHAAAEQLAQAGRERPRLVTAQQQLLDEQRVAGRALERLPEALG